MHRSVRPILVFTALICVGLAARAYAAEISNVTITNIDDSSAVVKWSTDVPTDATINYGLDSAVGIVRDPTFTKKEHELTIQNLSPLTTYHFRAVSSDEQGNTSATAGFVFSTKGKDELVKKILNDIEKVKEPEDLKKIIEKTQEVAQTVIKPPTILGLPRVIVETDSAEITWTTDRESSSVVYVAPEGEYSPGDQGSYSIVQGDSKESVKRHVVNVIGLQPATTYHFKVTSGDDIGLVGETEDDTFRTKAELPQISNLRVTRIQETSATVTWTTPGVPSRGLVSYTNARNRARKTVGSPIYTTNHSVLLAGLDFGTKYTVVASAMNETGDEVESRPVSFVTVRDVIAPAIAKVNNESTLFPSEDTKVQTIISWVTDEPATCQVFYLQGLVRSETNQGDALPAEVNPVSNHIQVVVGFAPATVYKFWMTCADPAGNETTSDDFVLITPIREKNIVDIILENFQGTFGWVNNVGK